MTGERTLTHRSGCDPREQTSTACPCGVTDAYRDDLDSQADDRAGQENRS